MRGPHLLLLCGLGAMAAMALGGALRLLRGGRIDWWHVLALGCLGASAALALGFVSAVMRAGGELLS